VLYSVYYCDDKRKEKLMDWTGGMNWRNEKLEKKKRSAKMKGHFHFKGLVG
jgi:hypothetical protein